jgi:hypothetical protein
MFACQKEPNKVSVKSFDSRLDLFIWIAFLVYFSDLFGAGKDF